MPLPRAYLVKHDGFIAKYPFGKVVSLTHRERLSICLEEVVQVLGLNQ